MAMVLGPNDEFLHYDEDPPLVELEPDQQPQEKHIMGDIVSTSPNQPLVVTDSDHGRHDKWLEAASLREATAGQRETNAAFRAADGERSRVAFAQLEAQRDSDRLAFHNAERIHISEKNTAEKISGVEKLVLEMRDQVKAEAVATRELMRDQQIERLRERASQAENKLTALYVKGVAPSDPSL